MKRLFSFLFDGKKFNLFLRKRVDTDAIYKMKYKMLLKWKKYDPCAYSITVSQTKR